jgi:hypothetical protein
MIEEDDCGAIGGMKIGRGNRSTRRIAFNILSVHGKIGLYYQAHMGGFQKQLTDFHET